MSEYPRRGEITEIANRHMARLLTNLEDAHCPAVYVQAVKTEMQWLRKDLQDAVDAQA